MTIPEAFEIAVQHHQAGQLAEAEALYRQILAAQPRHGDALHLLGVIAHQVGRDDLAVEWIRQAIVLNPNNPAAYSNLGEALRSVGRLEDAIAAYRGALRVNSNFPEAHNNLGNTLGDQGQLDEAVAAYRRALQLKPDYLDALNNLGAALARQGQLDEAIAVDRRALLLKPDYPEAHNNLGVALRERGQLDEAVGAFRQALELKPDYPNAHLNLGIALKELGKFDEAVAAYRCALQLKPDYPEAHLNLGIALRELGQLGEAVLVCRRALRLNPQYPDAHNSLGNALMDLNQLDEAVAAYRRALQIEPGYLEAHNNLGVALKDQGELDEAIAAFRRALQLKPDSAETLNNLGNALKDQGELDEAIAAFRRALQIKPENAGTHSNLVFTLHFHPSYDSRTISEEHQRWNRQFSEPLKQFIQPHANGRNARRRLRVGYVSPDFRDHAVGRYTLPLFERHDRARFEILCYSGVARPDWMTERFRALAGRWRNTIGISDARLAEIIREDGVDILVDLTLHTAGNRLPMFARKPAPVQASFGGYPGSAGVEAIKYRISDRHLEGDLPPASVGGEKVYLVESYWCYNPYEAGIEVNGLPAKENGRVTFGSLNNFCKVNEQVLRLWARVLGKVKESRLVLLSRVGRHRQRTLEAFEREGVEADRVELVEFRPRGEYFELYYGLDIALDTFPYNGHSTSLDALWMGVPVVSLAGGTPVSRAGLSQLTNLGLPELVARSESEYVHIAEGMARDLSRLADLRATLRARMLASPLMDAPRFARNVEAAYRSMWEAWRLAGG